MFPLQASSSVISTTNPCCTATIVDQQQAEEQEDDSHPLPEKPDKDNQEELDETDHDEDDDNHDGEEEHDECDRPRLSLAGEDADEGNFLSTMRGVNQGEAQKILRDFVHFSLVCSVVPSTAVACLALAAGRWGMELGAQQCGALYMAYTASALTGFTVLVIYHSDSSS